MNRVVYAPSLSPAARGGFRRYYRCEPVYASTVFTLRSQNVGQTGRADLLPSKRPGCARAGSKFLSEEEGNAGAVPAAGLSLQPLHSSSQCVEWRVGW